MKRISFTSLLFLLVALLSAGAAAQAPGSMMGPKGPPGSPAGPIGHHARHFGQWWKNSEVVKELQLTDPQIKQIEQTFLDYRLKLIDLRADVERQETKLQPLIDADQPDEQQVSAQVDKVLAARAKLEKTNTMMMLAIRRVLSVDQWKKLQALHQRRQNVFFERGVGPGHRTPGGGPPPPDAPPPGAD